MICLYEGLDLACPRWVPAERGTLKGKYALCLLFSELILTHHNLSHSLKHNTSRVYCLLLDTKTNKNFETPCRYLLKIRIVPIESNSTSLIRSEVPVSSIDFDFSDRQDRADDDYSGIQTEVRLKWLSMCLKRYFSFAQSIKLGQQFRYIKKGIPVTQSPTPIAAPVYNHSLWSGLFLNHQ